jgi:hypothetical protein
MIGEPQEYVCMLERTLNLPDPALAPSGVSAHYMLYELPWEMLTWNRVENEVSTCTVDLANDAYGRTCCTYPLQGWFQSIGVYRNGERVWWGPLMGWRTKGDAVSLAAMDMLAFAKRRFLAVDRAYSAIDAFTVIAELADDIYDISGDPLSLYPNVKVPWNNLNPTYSYPGAIAGFNVTRTYPVSGLTTFFDMLVDLHNEYGLYFSAGPNRAFYNPYEFIFENNRPVLNERTVRTKPNISVDCFNINTDTYLLGQNNGTGGYAKIVNVNTLLGTTGYGDPWTLDGKAEADPRTTSADLDLGYAGVPSAVEALAPRMTLEAMTLDPRFGSVDLPNTVLTVGMVRGFEGINDLVPGAFAARWGFEADCVSNVPVATNDPFRESPYSYYSTTTIEQVRLAQLNVTVSKSGDDLNEEISASFVPYAGP